MGSVRRGGGVLAAMLLAAGGVLPMAAPARAADVFVQVSPTTVQAGYLVGIRASCRSNAAAATVESPAFGMVTAQPQNGVLTAAAMVPDGTDAGTYRVRLSCPEGPGASTMLNVTAGGHPAKGPATGFGGAADGNVGGLLAVGGLATTVAGLVLGLTAARRRGAGPRPARGGARN